MHQSESIFGIPHSVLPYYFSITISGVLLTFLLLAFIFKANFRKDCLAKEGDLKIFNLFSVQGALVLCLFGLFGFGFIYPLTLIPERYKYNELSVKYETLEKKYNDVEGENANLVKRLEGAGGTAQWDVQIVISAPEDVPQDFDLSKGTISVSPVRFSPKLKKWPLCREKVCLYAMNVTTGADQSFEEGIKSITYENGSYIAHIYPKSILENYERGNKHLVTRIDDGVRHYGAIRVRHALGGE